jgi:hypothetical protein
VVVIVYFVTDSGCYPEDEDRDGLRNVGLLTAQPFDPADSPRELHHYLSIDYYFSVKMIGINTHLRRT